MQMIRCQCGEWFLPCVHTVPIVVFDDLPGPILTGETVDLTEYSAVSAGSASTPLTRCPCCHQRLATKTSRKDPLC
jgi:hypothetical protein